MDTLTLDNISSLININNNILTVKELLNTLGYPLNELYIDKFWDNLTNDKWIYIDNDMLKYIGYSENTIKAKQNYLNIISSNFEENTEYKSIFSKELQEDSKYLMRYLGNVGINGHNKTKHLIVSPDCFKQSLMLLRTEKAKEIRKYYLELEKVFKFYLQYQAKYQELQNSKITKELEETKKEYKKFVVLQSDKIVPLSKEEYVYATTNLLNAMSNINKIGKSKNLVTRLSNFNINALDENQFYHFIAYKCNDSTILESLIHSLLKPFNYKNELFQLHSVPLTKIVNKICTEYNKLTDLVNDYIENDYQNDLKLDIKIPTPLTVEELKNIKNDVYDSDDIEFTNVADVDVDKLAIEDHIYIYKGVKLYNCPRCKDFTCKERNTLLGHISRVNRCEENKDVDNKTLDVEELIKKNNIKLYPCKKCNKITFSTPAKLKRHEYSLTPCTEIFRCEPCNLDFRIEVDLNAHKNRITCLDNKYNPNNNVSKDVNEDLDPLNKIYVINGVNFYKCNLCNVPFKTKQSLKYHLNKKIKCNEMHYCNLCNKQFHTIENLRKHERNSTECDKDIFKCENCNKTFTSNKNLKKHVSLNTCVKDKY